MNLLIVDDEYYNVESIRMKIEKERPVFEQIYSAYNLKQALDIFHKADIAVMICDIEMPGGSGLELLEHVRRERYNTICIYLTAYAKFEYISQAMKLSTIDYLLKPVEDTQLFSSIDKAVLQFRKNESDIDNIIKITRMQENELSIQLKYWMELLEQNKLDELVSAVNAYLHQIHLYYSENSEMLENCYDSILKLLMNKLKNDDENAALELFEELIGRFLKERILESSQTMKQWVSDVLALYQNCKQNADNTDNAIATVKAYIHSHLDDKLDRDSLAAMVYLSPDYLSHCFKRETGLSLTNYIIEVRIQEAKRLLVKKESNIRDVALSCGFQNISYFTRQFKKSTGITPKEFRGNEK